MISPTSPPEGSISSIGQQSDSSGSAGNTQMGKQEFLKLLTAQLKNQDPMDPMKGKQFATQLAQFSSVEQLMNIEETLSNQSSDNDGLVKTLNNSMAAGLIGKTVQTSGNQIDLADGESADLSFSLDHRAANVEVTVRDQAGNAVRTMTESNLDEGAHTISWDGTADGGENLPAGSYSFDVQATGPDGGPIAAETFSRGTVEKVRFEEDGALLVVDGRPVPMSAVDSITR